MTEEESALVLRHFEQVLLRLTAALQMDEVLQASAVVLFKRYFLHEHPARVYPGDIVCVRA